ncbi:MAG: ATP-grasp domain-containing protein [Planctomycetes bacterium]|nr:ATP-grasp domain-containing protein [Planctomycetota bacterium]
MPNVLVFPCGTEIGLELHRALCHSRQVTLYGASSRPDHGRYVYRIYFETIPFVGDRDFADRVVRAVETYRIQYVFPAHDDAVVALAALQADGRLAARVVAPPLATCRICRSKTATASHFATLLPLPARYRPADLTEADFPLFIKPDAGQGSQGAVRVDDLAAARERLRRAPDDLILEYLPGREFTVDCFTDRDGRLRFLSARERLRVQRGISVACREADNPALAAMGAVINRHLPLRGAWFFQARENRDGEPVLLEIGARIAGSSGFQRGKGINLPLLALYDRMDQPVEILANALPGLRYDRALQSAYRTAYEYDTVYVDFDDTLVIRNEINTELVKFLYQCLNRNLRLVVLSRHDGDLEAALTDRRLRHLFDAVVAVPDDRPKSAYIHGPRAVFIDDSFAERQEVHRTAGIPVFDPSGVEALLL